MTRLPRLRSPGQIMIQIVMPIIRVTGYIRHISNLQNKLKPVKNIPQLLLLFTLLFPGFSCNKVKDYFKEPVPDPLIETIHTSILTGYAANISFAMISGHSIPGVNFIRSNPGFPCTSLITINTLNKPGLYLDHPDVNTMTIAALWADENTAILSMILTGYDTGTSTLDVLGIKTIPVIRTGGHINVAMASMDIQLNPDQDALLSINMNTLEIQTELLRLDEPRPTDVYVAVLQDAYFIDVDENLTTGNPEDDRYTITGGGQLITVNGSSAEITQQAMVGVNVSSGCLLNPTEGMALMKVTGLENQGFPELGTAVFEFTSDCGGTARVYAATGMYVGSNGKKIRFRL